jgi:hypothetical protein
MSRGPLENIGVIGVIGVRLNLSYFKVLYY